jgi:hypothetical protein
MAWRPLSIALCCSFSFEVPQYFELFPASTLRALKLARLVVRGKLVELERLRFVPLPLAPAHRLDHSLLLQRHHLSFIVGIVVFPASWLLPSNAVYFWELLWIVTEHRGA